MVCNVYSFMEFNNMVNEKKHWMKIQNICNNLLG